MRSDTPPITPRGRPPARVLIALTLTAVALHGCLLDGVPIDAPELPAVAAVPLAQAVQVRALPGASNDRLDERATTDVAGIAVEAPALPPATADKSSPKAARPARIDPLVMPATRPVAVEAGHAAEPVPETPAAAAPASAAPPEPVPASLASDSVPAALASGSQAPAGASFEASSEPVMLRQPERAVPVYRTRIPPATTLDYDISRGSIAGTGELTWRPEAGQYEARLQARVIGFTLLTQVSQGSFDAAGLAPLRFTDQRARKAARAANFQREAGKITFSGPRDEFALPAGSQDRLSWMIQLPAVLAAEPKRAAAGGEVVLYVAGARADVDVWTLRCIGAETVETASGPVRTVKFMRTPRSPKDTLAEVWLDPTRHYLPVRARLTSGANEDDAFELVLRELRAAP